MDVADKAVPPIPLGLIAELTHRCPLGCPYCSNPLALARREDEMDVATWARVFMEAAALGVPQVALSGGEPAARTDLPEIVACAREAGLATTLVTSGVGLATRTIRDLWEAGLDRVQVSIQDSDAVSSDHIAGAKGGFQRKYALAGEARRLGLPLTIGVVLHRANIGRIGGMVDLALKLGADRIEMTRVRYTGWAVTNRLALMPTRDQAAQAAAEIDALRQRHRGAIVIDAPLPDDQAQRGDDRWNGDWLTVTPNGDVLPHRAFGADAGATRWNVQDHALHDIHASSRAVTETRAPALNAGDAPVKPAPQPNPGYVYRRM
jgi:pyrroloquinoline quinone biosynthesis protein E